MNTEMTMNTGELNEAELEAVAGGALPVIVAVAGAVVGVAALGKAVYDYVDHHTPEQKVIKDSSTPSGNGRPTVTIPPKK